MFFSQKETQISACSAFKDQYSLLCILVHITLLCILVHINNYTNTVFMLKSSEI